MPELTGPDVDAIWDLSPVMDRLVALDVTSREVPESALASGRFGQLRRIGEGISMLVVADASGALAWQRHPLGRPLKARLADVAERAFRVDHAEEELPALLERFKAEEKTMDDETFNAALRDVLSIASAAAPPRRECVTAT